MKEVYIVMDGECSDGAMSSSPTVSGSGASAGCPGSPLSPLPSTSPTGKRRSAKKRVVTVPLADVTGPRPKGVGEGNTPTDSWAWRKYGQKPIKGSPYPRAYYRCSSSKGCPARKQVERNRADPAMVIVTYSSEHNHSGLVARAQSRQSQKPKAQPSPLERAEPEDTPAACAAPPAEDPAIEVHDDFRWLYDVVSVTSTSPSDETDEMMYGPMFLGTVDTAPLLPDELGDVSWEGSEEDALLEGLGELPECAMVFRRRAGGGLAVEVKVGQPPEGTAMT